MDVAADVLDHGFLAETVDDHLLVHQVADDVARSGAGHIDPDAREEGARAHHERAVEEEVERVLNHVVELARRADVVGEASNGRRVSLNIVLGPLAKETNEEVALELAVKHLGEEVQVGNEGGLQDDWDVGGVEELDWVRVGLTSLPLALQLQFDSEALYTSETIDE